MRNNLVSKVVNLLKIFYSFCLCFSKSKFSCMIHVWNWKLRIFSYPFYTTRHRSISTRNYSTCCYPFISLKTIPSVFFQRSFVFFWALSLSRSLVALFDIPLCFTLNRAYSLTLRLFWHNNTFGSHSEERFRERARANSCSHVFLTLELLCSSFIFVIVIVSSTNHYKIISFIDFKYTLFS